MPLHQLTACQLTAAQLSLLSLYNLTMESTLTKLAYQTFQQSKSALGLVHKALSGQLREWISPLNDPNLQSVPSEVMLKYRDRLDQLMAQDWSDAEAGIYPTSLLFDTPWADIMQYYPRVWLDLPKTWELAKNKEFQAFSNDINTDSYPQYYARNFHYQTDGYLSEESANLYDLQVEILFNGCADPMRRRVLAPLKQGLNRSQMETDHETQPHVLDVACGTGRTLRMIRGMLPEAALYGVDLSPTYLHKANQDLSELPGLLPQLIQANAEELPYTNDYFDGITCVFMLHELPGPVRQKVINECYRVTKPGGVFVICDSVQKSDSEDMIPFMNNFSRVFHEPFYTNYIEDNISARLEEIGFEVIETQIHLASKYWISRKPV